MRKLLQLLVTALAADLKLAIRNVIRQSRRSALGTSAVATGVVALLLASGFFEWNYDAMRENTIRARIGHIVITRPGYMDSGMADPFAFLLPATMEGLQKIETYPEIETIAPRLAFSGLISLGESTLSFFGEGVDPERERKLSGALLLIEGQDLSQQDRTGVILGQGLARTLGVRTGQVVVLVANTGSGGINATEVHVRGIFATMIKAYDDSALRLPIATAQQLLRVSGAHMWRVLLQRTAQTDRVLQRMDGDLASSQLELVPWYETAAADFYKKTASLFSKQVLVVKIMIGVIIVLSISNTMATNVRERIGEIGTCMALGDRPRTILRRFLVEGVLLGALGGLIGVALAIALAGSITWIGIPMPPPPGAAIGYVAGILVTPRLIAEALLLSLATAFMAGLYPAWKASRMTIADALRRTR